MTDQDNMNARPVKKVIVKRVSTKDKQGLKTDGVVISGLPNQEGLKTVKQAGSLNRKKKRLTNKQFITRALIGFVSIILVLFLGMNLVWNYLFSGLDTDGGKGLIPTEPLTNQPPSSKDITNILLLGVDARNPKTENGLSDSIIILTIDRKNNVIKMTSIMRDCYVYIPGYKNPEKINAANALGGPELAVRTVNNTLRLNIDKYMVVNMFSMADIIDIAGGVTLDITKKELSTLNHMLRNTPVDEGGSSIVSGYGTQRMTGAQAVMFARIRKIDSDSERSRRQRDVLKALFGVFRETNPIKKAQMIQKGLSSIKTNMTATEITSLGLDVLPKMSNKIEEMKLPLDGYYKVFSQSVWYMKVDYNRMIPEVYKFIYGKEQAFDPVPTVPGDSWHTNNNSKQPTVTINPTASSAPDPTEIPMSPTISPEPTLDPLITYYPIPTDSDPYVTLPEISPTITGIITISPTATPSQTLSPTLSPTPKNNK
ncbi:MAG: LCP family protein [Saccharofermentanales bacterium]